MTALPDVAESLAPEVITARFFHLEKLPALSRAPLDPSIIETLNAQIAQITIPELRALTSEIERSRRAASTALATEPDVRRCLESLPFHAGDVIVALGDSITDDLLSWAWILDDLLALERPDLRLRVVNAGITGHTTQEAISRFAGVAAARPTWIIQMLGTNDARRHGGAQIRTTSHDESIRNLAQLATLAAETRARHILMTPPPAIGELADAWEPFQLEGITWRDDDVAAIAQAVRDQDPAAVDVYAAFLAAADPSHLMPDGIHPTLAGQQLIARTVLAHLAE